MSTTYNAELSSLSDSSGIESLTDSMSGWSIDFKKTVWPRSDVKIVDKIGEGFYADVFLVREKKSGGKAMVLKQTKNGKPNEQLRNEINILSNISHVNILTLIAEIENREDCAIFELCSDGDLAIYIQRNGRLDLDTTKRLAKEITDGVAHLHDKMILHRDLKAENILLSGNSVRIGDFGGAVRLKKGETLTQLEGSPINCAPEMIKGEGYSFPRDWWSVGTMIYQMIAGRIPFLAADQMGIFVKILVEEPEYPSWVDGATLEVIASLLNKEQSTRAKADDLYQQCWFPGSKVPSHRSSVDSGYGDYDGDYDAEYESE